MTVKTMIEFLSKCDQESDVSIIYPEDNYGEEPGVCIDSMAYIQGTKGVHAGVYIKLE